MFIEHFNTPYFWLKVRKKNTYFVFDYDGTLSPIVSDPEMAFLRPRTKILLDHLYKVSKIGIISGRSLSDLKTRIEFKTDFLSGTHGLESPFSSGKEHKEYQAFFKDLQNVLKDIYPELFFEKKTVGFTVHYRKTENSKVIIRELLELLETFPEIKIIGGKKVLNILPNRPHNKGWVMEKLLQKNPHSHFIYIGDDTTDEDIFKIRNDRLISIRIGKSSKTSAPLYIHGQKEIDQFLWSVLSFKGISIPPQFETK